MLWLLFLLTFALGTFRAYHDYQTPGPFDVQHLGFCDFHNGVYFPAKAWLRGDNPYSGQYAAEYPVMRQVPLYAPFVFPLHAWLATLPLSLAEIAYQFTMLIIVVLIGRTVANSLVQAAPQRLRIWHGPLTGAIALLVALSRAGHTTIHSGYFTLELTLATLLVFHWAQQRPNLAVLALAFTAIKPTYAIPLGWILLAQGRFRLVGQAVALATTLSLLALAPTIRGQWRADPSGSLSTAISDVVETMRGTQDVHREQNWEKPAISWTRVDLLGAVAKWTRSEPNDVAHLGWMVVILLSLTPFFWRSRHLVDSRHLVGYSTAMALAAMLVSLYRHAYDTGVLVAPVCGACLACCDWQTLSGPLRRTVAGLLAFPLVNYLSTRLVLEQLPAAESFVRVVCGLNTAAITSALLVLILFNQRRLPPFCRRTESERLEPVAKRRHAVTSSLLAQGISTTVPSLGDNLARVA